MSSEPRKVSTWLLVFLILWLGLLTILVATPIGRSSASQSAGAEQSTRQMLCTDALERRQAAEKVLASTSGSTSLEYGTWKKALVIAQTQLDQANADKGVYCR
jgi:hypothetical protein